RRTPASESSRTPSLANHRQTLATLHQRAGLPSDMRYIRLELGYALTADPAAARGRKSVKLLPRPSVLCTSIRPPSEVAICFTMLRPNPVPPRVRERDRSTR